MDNFLRFLEKDDSFLTPWAAPIPEDQQLQEEVQADRRENDHAQAPFSFFSRQWDYYENLRKEGEGRSDHNPDGDDGSGNSSGCACQAKTTSRTNMPGHAAFCCACEGEKHWIPAKSKVD